MCDLLEMVAERRGRPQVIYYRVGGKTKGLYLKERWER